MKRSSLVLFLTLSFGVAYASADTKKSSHYASTTLTGCLAAGSDAKTFVLTNATLPGGAAAAADRWELTGAPASLKMADHVGHKVEVKGKEGADHHLQVHTLKHVSPTCP
jgi:hypothetical protein